MSNPSPSRASWNGGPLPTLESGKMTSATMPSSSSRSRRAAESHSASSRRVDPVGVHRRDLGSHADLQHRAFERDVPDPGRGDVVVEGLTVLRVEVLAQRRPGRARVAVGRDDEMAIGTGAHGVPLMKQITVRFVARCLRQRLTSPPWPVKRHRGVDPGPSPARSAPDPPTGHAAGSTAAATSAVAARLLDERGLEALSMRAVAREPRRGAHDRLLARRRP